MSTQIAHMVVEGAFIVQTARDMMLSEMTAKAWRLISSGLIGDENTEKLAIQILEGTKTLEGDSELGISVADEADASRYLETLRYIYVGRVRIGKGWYRPKAIITRFGPLDAAHAARVTGVEALPTTLDRYFGVEVLDAPQEALTRFTRARASFYLLEGERAVLANVDGQRRFWVFEPTGEIPFWWTESTDKVKAIREWLDAGHRPDELECPESDRAQLVAELTQDDEMEEGEAKWLAQDLLFKQKCASIRARVLEKAGTDMMPLEVEGRTYQVPRAPFTCWALRRTHLAHLAPEWDEVAPSGMKLPMDDPSHTDWMLGAGFNIGEDAGMNSPVMKAALDRAFQLQTELADYKIHVLSGLLDVTGVVGEDVVVLPDLSPHRIDALEGARAVITEQGGALAHLAQVALERGLVMVRVKGAVQKFPTGTKLTISLSQGEIEIL
jgi:phosphohistidine swiveling domain-containing protein